MESQRSVLESTKSGGGQDSMEMEILGKSGHPRSRRPDGLVLGLGVALCVFGTLAVTFIALYAHAVAPGQSSASNPNCTAAQLPDERGPRIVSAESAARRTPARFQKARAADMCWDRDGKDGNTLVIDIHNHWQPFGGPAVDFATFVEWMSHAGIAFSTVNGIGQMMVQTNPYDPTCCYYLHCPLFNYSVVPMTVRDVQNAEAFRHTYLQCPERKQKMGLLLAATFANFQAPAHNGEFIDLLQAAHDGQFSWAGEINVFKHGLAANGFFDPSPTNQGPVTLDRVHAGELDSFFSRLAPDSNIRAVTLHCDLGCDNYKFFENILRDYGNETALADGQTRDGTQAEEMFQNWCVTPAHEVAAAHENQEWWKELLGPYFNGFFDETGHPKDNFKKLRHVPVLDAIIRRYPYATIVLAHAGLSGELTQLSPAVHVHVLSWLLNQHPHLYIDLSWTLLMTDIWMNMQANMQAGGAEPEDQLKQLRPCEGGRKSPSECHEDVPAGAPFEEEKLRIEFARMEAVWANRKGQLDSPGGGSFLSEYRCSEASTDADPTREEEHVRCSGIKGPSYVLAQTFELVHKHYDRLLTGTDFVASMGQPLDYPGTVRRGGKGKGQGGPGCVKTEAILANQVADVSSINLFMTDTEFRHIVLGIKFFNISRLHDTYAAPEVCS